MENGNTEKAETMTATRWTKDRNGNYIATINGVRVTAGKSVKREYYTRILARPNRDGLVNVACSALVTDWWFKVDGQAGTSQGNGTLRQAKASAIRAVEYMRPA